MEKLNYFDWSAIALSVIGAMNWGLVGVLNVDLVASLFGTMSIFSRIIYTLVGIAGVYLIYTVIKLSKMRG